MSTEIKQKIANTLATFATGNLYDNAIELFTVLGYNTERRIALENGTPEVFKAAFVKDKSTFNEAKACVSEWKQIHLLF